MNEFIDFAVLLVLNYCDIVANLLWMSSQSCWFSWLPVFTKNKLQHVFKCTHLTCANYAERIELQDAQSCSV
jgi:hypothetical protein